MPKYKFRAECFHDVQEFIPLVFAQGKPFAFKIYPDTLFPDAEVEIEADISLEDMRSLMRQVFDSHVMVQTVMPIDQYTGERNYEL